MEKKYNLFIDLDGVLVDFNKGYFELTGTDIGDRFHGGKAFWDPIDKAGVEFWVDLTWTEDGKKLWDYVKEYKPEILSSPSDKDESKVGKRKWVEKELPDTHLILRSAENKKEFACLHCILIDDRKSNIDSWKDAGGIGILHKSAKETIKQLKKYSL